MSDKIKQLENRLKKTDDNTPEKVDILNELAYEISVGDWERAKQLGDESFELAQKLQYGKGLAYAKRLQGLFHYVQSDIEKAMPYMFEALQWFEENEDRKGEAGIKGFLGMIYWSFGDFERGFEFSFQALKMLRSFGRTCATAWSQSSSTAMRTWSRPV